ncbi:hypothetical protein [uncultured Thiodictyon sp.]|uniref:ParB/RepB/Spo0J family partition protein n=1 Tax=uncultured Thiodictyon sp. TaxID=1846217 RepID=UPI0025DC9A54|nr:hypothetical protein [uncultured Thiodictyon sp.]
MDLNSDVAAPSLTVAPDCSTERKIPVEQVHRSPYRPVALVPGPSAIAAWLLNPDAHNNVLVRRRPKGGYELLVGEFDWRLAQAARCDTIRVKVLDRADDGLARQLATLDADQDLKHLPHAATHEGVLPWSGAGKLVIARAIQLLNKEKGWSLTESARLFGLSRTEGAHYVRVLTLPSKVLDLLAKGSLSFGQARALSRLSAWPTTALLLATKVAALPGTPARARRRVCSVREVERRVSKAILQLEQDNWNGESDVGKKAKERDAHSGSTDRASGDLRRAEMLLTDHCGFPVRIEFDAKSHTGRLVLRFASVDEFHVLADLLAPGIDFDES